MTSIQIGATPSPQAKVDVNSASQLVFAGSDIRYTSDSQAKSPVNSQSQSAGGAFSKGEVRQSLKASTLDGAFSSAFENIVRGVLISNFLLELGAGTFEVGLLTSIPMLAHLLQPLGAYFSERTTSRHRYCFWIYGISRLLWLLPAGGIFLFSHGVIDAHVLTLMTMAVLAASNVLDSLGAASWVSWMAVLVPSQLRGRYFSLRRSLSSLVALLTIPVGGWAVSNWMGGEIEGYAIVLIMAIAFGLASLAFQFKIQDVNPQEDTSESVDIAQQAQASQLPPSEKVDSQKAGSSKTWFRDRNFLTLLAFLALWTFGLNLSAPFFNVYLLDTLDIDVQWVTLYSSLIYGAFFLMIMLWGQLADRIGNRPVLMINGLLMALLPLLWLYIDSSLISLWILLPLLHIVQGGTFAAMELCLSNVQMEVAPKTRQSGYFAIAAAIMGISGALGTTAGSLLGRTYFIWFACGLCAFCDRSVS